MKKDQTKGQFCLRQIHLSNHIYQKRKTRTTTTNKNRKKKKKNKKKKESWLPLLRSCMQRGSSRLKASILRRSFSRRERKSSRFWVWSDWSAMALRAAEWPWGLKSRVSSEGEPIFNPRPIKPVKESISLLWPGSSLVLRDVHVQQRIRTKA